MLLPKCPKKELDLKTAKLTQFQITIPAEQTLTQSYCIALNNS